MQDLTGQYDYARLIDEERRHYSSEKVTDQLMLGGIHAHGSWEYYWERVGERIRAQGFKGVQELLAEDFAGLDRPVRVLSIGAGHCGMELLLAERLGIPVEITCLDINEELFGRAQERAESKGLLLRFEVGDMNFLDIPPRSVDMVIAHASMHHAINLEHLFERIARGLGDRGVFHLVDVMGQNRTLIWPENLAFVNRALRLLPSSIRRFARINPRAEEGMEGIRQEDTLPILRQHFTPVFELRHGAFMRSICLHRRLGAALDPRDPERRRYLDLLIDLDESVVRRGLLRPLEIWGVYRTGEGEPPGSRSFTTSYWAGIRRRSKPAEAGPLLPDQRDEPLPRAGGVGSDRGRRSGPRSPFAGLGPPVQCT